MIDFKRLNESLDIDESSANPFEPKATGKVKTTTGGIGDTSMTARPKDQTAPPELDDPEKTWHTPGYVKQKGPSSAGQKPGYRGSFFGQSVTLGRQRVGKNVAWKDKETGQSRFGKTQGWADKGNTWVWDGNDWIRPGAFDSRFGKYRRRSESLLRSMIPRRIL